MDRLQRGNDALRQMDLEILKSVEAEMAGRTNDRCLTRPARLGKSRYALADDLVRVGAYILGNAPLRGGKRRKHGLNFQNQRI